MTKVATTMSCTMMRIFDGIPLRSSEITRFDRAVTTVTDRAITIAGFSFAVTASDEQIPKISTVIGLALRKGAVIRFKFLLMAFKNRLVCL